VAGVDTATEHPYWLPRVNVKFKLRAGVGRLIWALDSACFLVAENERN